MDTHADSYAAFSRKTILYKQALTEYRVARGDRVLLAGGPSSGYGATLWALFQLGAIACPLNPALPLKSIAEIVALLQPKLAVHDEDREHSLTPFPVKRVSFQKLRKPLDTAPSMSLSPVMDGSIPATIVMTSGSTGSTKAAVHSLNNHIAAARAANVNMPLGKDDVWLLSLPLYHVSGLAILFRCALSGAAVAVPKRESPLEDELMRTGATYASLVPTQLYRLIQSGRGIEVLRKMKGVLLGGAPIDNVLVKRVWEAGIPLVRSYGMTETSAQICATRPGASLADMYSNGRPLIAESVRVSESGGIEVRGPSVFLGYYRENGEILKPETEDGWFRTGDCGHWDAQGCLHVTGRADTMFISGGENIYPEEIEAALGALAEVEQVAVVGMPDREYGFVPVAFIKMRNPYPVCKETLNTRLRPLLPGYKLPRCYLPWLENLGQGIKPNRPALCEEALKYKKQ